MYESYAVIRIMHKPMKNSSRTTFWTNWRSRPSHWVQYLVTASILYL